MNENQQYDPNIDYRILYAKVLSRVSWILAAFVIVLFVGSGATTYFYYKVENQAEQNTNITEHLCRTSSSLALAFKSAADQIQNNLDTGVYAKALREGRITTQNVTYALETRDMYRDSAMELTRAGNPCAEIQQAETDKNE